MKQIVEAVAARAARAVEVYALEALHDVDVIGDLKVGDRRLAEPLDLDVLRIVLADGHGRVDHLRDDQHALADLGGELVLFDFELGELFRHGRDLLFSLFGARLVALGEQAADLLADHVALIAQIVAASLAVAELLVKRDNFVDKDEFFVLELLLDVLFDRVRIAPDEFYIQHKNTCLC